MCRSMSEQQTVVTSIKPSTISMYVHDLCWLIYSIVSFWMSDNNAHYTAHPYCRPASLLKDLIILLTHTLL